MPRLLVLVIVALFAVPGAGAAGNTMLIATVGPGFTIAMTDASVAPLGNIQLGTYEILVRDRADMHNFHLTGPGVNRATDVEAVGEETWTVTLTDGVYRFVCDPHVTIMRGQFTVGTGGRLLYGFGTILPNSPLSYSGSMVKIRWCARVRLFLRRGKELFFEQPFVLSAHVEELAGVTG